MYVPNSEIPNHLNQINLEDFDFIFEAYCNYKILSWTFRENFLKIIFAKFKVLQNFSGIEQIILYVIKLYEKQDKILKDNKFLFENLFEVLKITWDQLSTNTDEFLFFEKNQSNLTDSKNCG